MHNHLFKPCWTISNSWSRDFLNYCLILPQIGSYVIVNIVKNVNIAKIVNIVIIVIIVNIVNIVNSANSVNSVNSVTNLIEIGVTITR